MKKKLIKKSLIKKLTAIQKQDAWLDFVFLPILIFSPEEWDLLHTKEGLRLLKERIK